MKKLLIALLLLVAVAEASQAALISCDYHWSMDFPNQPYVGTYRSYNGNVYQYRFRNYCPQTVNLGGW